MLQQQFILALASPCDRKPSNRNEREPAGFFSEVSSQYSLENPTPPDPANAPVRVFAEIALLLGAIAMIILWLTPGP